MAEFGPALRERPVRIDVPAGLAEAEGDPEFVQQVIKQFLENALKYSPPDSPISISARAEGAKIVIGVADQGPGIQENERARIFDKFFRGREHRFATTGNRHGAERSQKELWKRTANEFGWRASAARVRLFTFHCRYGEAGIVERGKDFGGG